MGFFDDVCFLEIIKGFVIQFFNFVEVISISRRLLEKLFKILDLYDVLVDFLLDIEIVFILKLVELIRV